MCNCVEELTAELKKHYAGVYKKKTIESLCIPTLVDFKKGGVKTYSEAVISLPGQKKEERIVLAHSHCPFCGIKLAE